MVSPRSSWSGKVGWGTGGQEIGMSRLSRVTIGVMGSGTDAHEELAVPLGQLLARLGVNLLTGGGAGTMTAVGRAFREARPEIGITLGVIPSADEESPGTPRPGYPNPFVELPILTHLPHSAAYGKGDLSRNHINVLSSTAIVALPGAEGTTSEVELACEYGIPLVAFCADPSQVTRFPKEVRRLTTLDEVEEFLRQVLSRPVRTGYAPVNDLELYFEIHGTQREGRPPLVLLHGGGDTIGTSFGQILHLLALERQVIAFEQQGYGHTADVLGRPFTFEQSADDTAALLSHLGIEQADLLGFSNGGTIALQVAIRHPERVRSLVLASALAKRDGAHSWLWEFMANATLEQMPPELQSAYREVAPRPDDLRVMHDKAAERMKSFTDIADDAIRSVDARTLIVIGDSDVVVPEHAVQLSRLLPNAQLAVLPDTNHMQVTSGANGLVPMVNRFLEAQAT